MLSFRACRPALAVQAPCRSISCGSAQLNHIKMLTVSSSAQDTMQHAVAADGVDAKSVQQPADPLVQWVVLRRDLWHDMGWPLGAVVAQACHASTAAMFAHLSEVQTQEYLHPSNIDHMHKVVLEVKSEQQLANLSLKLQQEGIQHKLWVEQPEDFPTCLATRPYRKSQLVSKSDEVCKSMDAGCYAKTVQAFFAQQVMTKAWADTTR